LIPDPPSLPVRTTSPERLLAWFRKIGGQATQFPNSADFFYLE
jgi:hypothetical protein